MRLTTIRRADGTAAGRVDGDRITVLPHADLGALLAEPGWRERARTATGDTLPLATADFAPLVPRPEKVICVGINYRDHIAEVGAEAPEHPTLFAKYARSLIGARDDLVLPGNSGAVDWEAELGVVIGSTARHLDRDAALEAVAGYTIVNDVSMRDWQLRTSQFLQGKTFEASTPVGPFLVTPDEVGHAGALGISCLVDGEVVQRSVTSELVFSVAEIVSYVSSFITLVPGDLIATGTPGGIGATREPPRFLAPGQTLTTRIDGLGEQANRCLAPLPAGAEARR
ncbi:fumarylacetoacetate hydrolase family protein [Actinomadura sp. WMMB 499]|uniref:fumarylacetoacetate hydrolase family protein n=1 Tax=Actinomadura sp. WMMB 499 TaxID=1219491 RepID=UPI0012479FE6|nr:fumarylacetoacetate hydrolase family protein [Actinomadura sp. WMMB 499]QFG21341.1 fumarylacetoacetate hydrolase family protein [Actinomadura sp. WMMB 499]